MLGGDPAALALDPGLGRRAEEIAALAVADLVAGQAGHLGEIAEERDPFAHQRDLFRIVELEAEGAGGDGRRQRRQRRPRLQHDRREAGAAGEEGRRRADDAAADDD